MSFAVKNKSVQSKTESFLILHCNKKCGIMKEIDVFCLSTTIYMRGNMKEGLIFENDGLIYYKHGEPYHAGVIESDGDIYYIGRGGIPIKGVHVVHTEMTNGLLKHGTYTFGDDGKLIEGSYLPPKKLKSSKKNSTKKKKRKIKKKNIAIVISAALAVAVLCAASYLIPDRPGGTNSGTDDQNSSKSELSLPSFDSEVLLCTSEAKQLYDGKCTVTEALGGGNPYLPFVFKYTLSGEGGVLHLSENADLTNSRTYILSADNQSLAIDNLKTGTVYYYKVESQGNEHLGSFKTAQSTRFLYFPGVHNTRDIGGYTTLDNKTVKQGYIIRGSEIDGLVLNSYYLNADHIEQIQSDFGFVFEMDLREQTLFSGRYVSRFGSETRHRFYTAPTYGEIFNDSYKQSLKDIFSDLANPKNYPIYIHCTYGADRTGTVIFLLQGLLNMSEQQMLTEYQLTAFRQSSYATNHYLDIVRNNLQGYEGDTIQEKIKNFLIEDIGVTEQEIESIRNILLED